MAKITTEIIVNHHFELYRELAESSDSFYGVEFCLTSNNSFPNFIFNENPSFEIEPIKALIEQNNLPDFWITSSKEVASQINREGFKLIRAWPLLSMNQEELIQPRKVSGFSLTKITKPVELIEWKQIVEAEYNYSFTLEHLSKWLAKSKIDLFIGRVNDTVVSATLNFNHNNIVGSHLTATKAEHRKKGIGMQTVYSALHHAFENGNKLSIASTTELGQNAWEKIGYNILDDKLYINWFLKASK